MSVIVRAMTSADLDQIDRLEERIFPDAWPVEAFEDHLEDPAGGGSVALSDDVIIGYACYHTGGGQLHLTNLAVDPVHRRKSVANTLLDYILDLAREQGCELIFLEVRSSNETARKFYESAGFSVIDTCAGYYDDPAEDAVVMSRWIELDGDGR